MVHFTGKAPPSKKGGVWGAEPPQQRWDLGGRRPPSKKGESGGAEPPQQRTEEPREGAERPSANFIIASLFPKQLAVRVPH